MKRFIGVGGLSVVLGLAGMKAWADAAAWRPATGGNKAPAASLGQPVPRGGAAASTALRDPALTPASHTPDAPAPAPSVVRGQNFDLTAGGPPPVPPPEPI